jgi:hypothetical protein
MPATIASAPAGSRAVPVCGEHPQRRLLSGAEVDVLAGDRADERQLQHLREPQRPRGGAPEHPRERLVQRGHVQQRLVDVERDDPHHDPCPFHDVTTHDGPYPRPASAGGQLG